MNPKLSSILLLVLASSPALVKGNDDDWDDDAGWGVCYFDDQCILSCGEAQVAEDCLNYQQIFRSDLPPDFDIPPMDVPYFKLGRDGPCESTKPGEEPPKIGYCCDSCGNCEKNIYSNPDGCHLMGKPIFYDRVDAFKDKNTDESNPDYCYEVDDKGNKVVDEIPDRKSSTYGDPHFKTWTGDKFDYHGECDLVLIDNPTFMDGLGLKLHVRTTRINYYSYIERIALQVGDETLEFANDVDNFLINGKQVEPNRRYHKTKLSGFLVRRGDKKSISVRLSKENYKRGSPRIDFIARAVGFPAVVVNSEGTDIFKGSLGLLGDWSTGKRLARDGTTLMTGEDATDFALEWQVRDTEPMLFNEIRAPQYPTQCTPPAKIMGNRLGSSHMREQAEQLCASWKDDKQECIFDVMATRDIEIAKEGAIKLA